MDYRSLTEKIVTGLVMNTDAVRVQEFTSEDDDAIVLEVLVAEEDIGRVIGKGGKTANAIRTLVQASSSLHDQKYVKINFDKF